MALCWSVGFYSDEMQMLFCLSRGHSGRVSYCLNSGQTFNLLLFRICEFLYAVLSLLYLDFVHWTYNNIDILELAILNSFPSSILFYFSLCLFLSLAGHIFLIGSDVIFFRPITILYKLFV